MSVARMCISSMVIGLCKFDEITQYYGKEIRGFPDELKGEIYSIKQEIEKRKCTRIEVDTWLILF